MRYSMEDTSTDEFVISALNLHSIYPSSARLAARKTDRSRRHSFQAQGEHRCSWKQMYHVLAQISTGTTP